MPVDLHISNIHPETDIDTISQLVGDYGTVIEVHPQGDMSHPTPKFAVRARIEMEETDLPKLLEALNNREYDGRRLIVSPHRPPAEFRPFPKELLPYADEVAKTLNETERTPREQIKRMINYCTKSFVESLLELTLQTEAEGGVLISDGSRRRTVGGVFFHLARRNLSYLMMREVLFQSGGKKRKSKKPTVAKGKPKGKPQDKKAAPDAPEKPALPKAPPKPKAPAAEVPAEVRQQYEKLRQELSAAQQGLEELKAKPGGARGTGLFSATREVVNLQKELNNLLKKHPGLDG